MPNAAPKPCRHAGCGVLARDGSGFCSSHQADKHINKFSDMRRGSRQSRGYDSAWEKKRKWILCRDKGLCQPCLRAGDLRPAKQVDHIVSKAEAKAKCWTVEQTEADDNLQSICIACHEAKTAEEAKRGRGL